ncbi:hyalin-like [Anneissia japonica]|uniref:hyalin-like n=1 Tax=Anneissia japonica TaxID=1529436 RepID=UPI0014258EE7|nr:hyalin-like [Anneissia japonica]
MSNDPCSPNPCNEGICSSNNFITATCDCSGTGMKGNTCNKNDPCSPNPCNGGICTSHNNVTATCDCTGTGMQGEVCELINPCFGATCMNGGTCNDLGNGTFYCNCTGNYEGDKCETYNPCLLEPCVNGQCYIINNIATCNCTGTGYGGTACEQDIEGPVLTCPLSYSTNTQTGKATRTIEEFNVTVEDNSGEELDITSDFPVNATFGIGSTLVTYNAIDSSTNQGMCTVIVTIYDQEPPDINCPSNIFMQSAVGVPRLFVTWDQVNATDNSQIPPTITSKYKSNDSFPVGITEVNYNATDGSGNLGSCSFTVSIEAYRTFLIEMGFNKIDGMPYDFTEALLNSTSSEYIDIVFKLCDSVSNISSLCRVNSFTNGSVIVHFELSFSQGTNYTDDTLKSAINSSKTSEVFFLLYIDVTDLNKPGLACPDDKSQLLNDSCFVDPMFEVSGTDHVGNLLSATCTPMIFNSTGNYTITCLVTDMADNFASCIFFYTLSDEIAPNITCPSDVEFCNDKGSDYTNATWDAAIATDNCCSDISINANYTNGVPFSIGVYTVGYEATDCNEVTGYCQFTVAIKDCEPPVLECPSNQNVTGDSDCMAAAMWAVPTITDNSGDSFSAKCDYMSGSTFSELNSTVTCNATDDNANTGYCTFNIFIIDSTSPNVTCPDDITVDNGVGANTAEVTWESAVATDNCCGDNINVSYNATNVSHFYIGVTKIATTAVDCYGNQNECVFLINVEDKETPVLECPPNQNLTADSICMATATWIPPNVTDNSRNTFIPVCDYVNGSTFSYNTIVTCNATDDYDNTGNCTFTVTVIDKMAPNITCPDDIEICTYPLVDATNVTWERANATDNCCREINVTANYTSGDSLSRGVYTIGYAATDCNANVGYCQFTVNVKDCEPPDLECPPNQMVIGDQNCMANVTWTAPNVTDNLGESISPVCDYVDGSTFYDVSTVVTCNATDSYDNTGNCTFAVNIYDNADPVVNCPADIEVCAQTGSIVAPVTWEPINATDNCCGNVNITSNYTSGDQFEIGVHVVTYTATDCSENSAHCSFTIVVFDCEAPVLNCSQVVEFDADDNCTSDVTWNEVTATDNYDSNVTVFCSLTEGIFPLNNYTVTCSATDISRNTGNCSFSFYIFDVTAPNIVCPDNVTIDTNAGANTAVVTWTSAIVSDNCCEDEIIVSYNATNGTNFKIGVTEVSFTAVDCYGNQDECVFIIDVEDNESPILQCPPDQNVTADSNCMATATWAVPNVTDNSGDIFSSVCDYFNGGIFSQLNSTVTCNATDDYDNTGYCTFNILIVDDTAPDLTCPVDIEVCTDPENDSVNANWQRANVTDNCCSEVNITYNYTSGDTLSLGVYTVGYAATDCNGNSDYCQFTVDVKGTKND